MSFAGPLLRIRGNNRRPPMMCFDFEPLNMQEGSQAPSISKGRPHPSF